MDLHVYNERIDDIPLLFNIMKKMQLDKTIDKYFVPHKNWVGFSPGTITTIWLCYILTTYDHRLSYLYDWVEKRKLLFKELTGQEIELSNFADDKLELLLDYFSDITNWNPFEVELNKNTIRIFKLDVEVLRFDATIGQSFSKIIKDGLLQRGNSKHFREDLPQFKTMLCSLDPLGYPLTSLTVEGNSADDPLYSPVIKEAIKSLSGTGYLFVGDTKMGSIGTRALVERNSHYYLCPLSLVQFPKLQLQEFLIDVKKNDIKAEYVRKDGIKIAKGYMAGQWLHCYEDGHLDIWYERRFIVRSYVYANTQIKSLTRRLEKAKTAIEELNQRTKGKKTYTDKDELQLACEKILENYKVKDLICINIVKDVTFKNIRPWKDRPERVEEQIELTVSARVDQEKLNNAKDLLGWQIYATNSQDKEFNLTKAVLLYRNEYIIERRFNYLKNKPLNLTPLFLRKKERIVGLIHLLLLALKVISLIEHSVSRQLLNSGESLEGLYPGNPQRKTSRPSISLILRVFKEINLNLVKIGQIEQYVLDELNVLQIKLLCLLSMKEDIYNLYKGHSNTKFYEQQKE